MGGQAANFELFKKVCETNPTSCPQCAHTPDDAGIWQLSRTSVIGAVSSLRWTIGCSSQMPSGGTSREERTRRLLARKRRDCGPCRRLP